MYVLALVESGWFKLWFGAQLSVQLPKADYSTVENLPFVAVIDVDVDVILCYVLSYCACVGISLLLVGWWCWSGWFFFFLLVFSLLFFFFFSSFVCTLLRFASLSSQPSRAELRLGEPINSTSTEKKYNKRRESIIQTKTTNNHITHECGGT